MVNPSVAVLVMLPQDGSAARFADVRMVLFPGEDAARAYVTAYR